MHRSCFALSVLMGCLATSVIVIGSANKAAGQNPNNSNIVDSEDLATGYDAVYDEAVYGAKDPSKSSQPTSNTSYHREGYHEYGQCGEYRYGYGDCWGYDWYEEEYEAYDYPEDHQTVSTGSIDLDGLRTLANSVVRYVQQISPSSCFLVVNQKIGSYVSAALISIAVASNGETSKAPHHDELTRYPCDDECGWDEWSCWDQDDDVTTQNHTPAPAHTHPTLISARGEETDSGQPNAHRALILLLARTLDRTGQSLQSASRRLTEMVGIDGTELSRNPNEGADRR